jgi:hypothetical protein
MVKHLFPVALLVSASFPQDRPSESPDIAERVRAASAAFERAHQKFEQALVDLGPAAIPELERLSGKVQSTQKEAIRASIEKTRELQEPLEKLIAQLGEERIETREKASAELRRIGRPARPYLEAALQNENAEIRARSKVLLVMISPQDREQVRWAAIAEAQGKRVELMEKQMKSGTVGGIELLRAKRDLLKARHKAGQVSLQDYLKGARELVDRAANLAQVNFNNGVITRKDHMAVKLELLYLDRRLGKSVDKEIETLQMQWMELARVDKARGRLGEPEMLKDLVAFLTDPDEDLDD